MPVRTLLNIEARNYQESVRKPPPSQKINIDLICRPFTHLCFLIDLYQFCIFKFRDQSRLPHSLQPVAQRAS